MSDRVNHKAVLCDIGMSRVERDSDNSTSPPPLTSAFFRYVPPEVKAGKEKVNDAERPSMAGDVYSCAILFLWIGLHSSSGYATRDLTFQNVSHALLVEDRARSNIYEHFVPASSQFFGNIRAPTRVLMWELIDAMTAFEPARRPAMAFVHDRIFSMVF